MAKKPTNRSSEKELTFVVPKATVGRAEVGVRFSVTYLPGKLGELTVSQGGLRWKVANGRPRIMTWEKLNDAMAPQKKVPKVRKRNA